MTEDEIIQKIQEFVEGRFAYAIEQGGDQWLLTLGNLLPIYLQLQTLKRLDSIGEHLSTMSDDSWNDHHER